MSLYIVLENEIKGFDSYVNGHALGGIAEEEGATCAAKGVKGLMSFFSSSPGEGEDLLEAEGVEPSDIPIPEEQWFAASDGLAALAVLGEHYAENADLVAEIQEWTNVLKRAEQEGVRWHLAVDF